MKEQKIANISLINIEAESIELEYTLQQPVSLNLKRLVFLSFFNKLSSFHDQEPFRSYYLQFENYFPKICSGIFNLNWEPKQILQLKKIVNNFNNLVPDTRLETKFAAINIKLIAAIALSYFYVGEPVEAGLMLGFNSFKKDFFKEEMSEIGKAFKLYSIVKNSNNSIFDTISHYLKSWEESSRHFAVDNIKILLVDDFSNYHKTIESEGIIATLNGLVRERPTDVEEDRIILNNRTQKEDNSLYYALNDAIAAGKQISGLPGAIRNKHFSFQLSVSEKDAQLFGNSIGVGAGLLAYTIMLNRYYRMNVAGIGGGTAITGCIQQNGKITPVDSSGLKAKLKAAFFSPLKRAVVPEDNLEEAIHYVNELKELYPNRHLAVDGINSLSHLIENKNIFKLNPVTYRQKAIAAIRRKPQNTFILILSVLIIILMVLSFIKPLQWWRDTNPVNLEIRDRIIVAKNKSGEFLWSYEFQNMLKPERYINAPNNTRKKIFNDLDGDGRNELILGTYDILNPGFSGRVYSFSSEGELNWIYKAGKLMKYGNDYYSEHYKIESIIIENFGTDNEKHILLNVSHWPYFPSNLILLNSVKNVLGEYWNSGRFYCCSIHDIDQDSIKEILAGGINNEGQQAFLAILDPTNMWGSSPQSREGNYYTQNVPTGTQKFYIRFPKSPFNYARQGDTVSEIICYREYFTVVIGNYNMYKLQKPFRECLMYEYRFGYDMELQQLTFNDPFATQYFEQFQKELSLKDKEILKKIEYWNGEQWLIKPTINKIWKKMKE